MLTRRLLVAAALATTALAGQAVPAAESSSWQGGFHFPSGSTGPIALHGGYAYVLNAWSRGDGILVFDIRKPGAPAFVGGIPARGYLKHCAIGGDALYVDAGFSLMVVDAGRPETCRLVRNLSFGFPVMDVGCLAVAGDRLYVGGQGGGLRMLDISEPQSPVLLAHHPSFGRIQSLAAADDLVLVQPQGGEAVLLTATGETLTERSRLQVKGTFRLVGRSLYVTDPRKTTIYDLRDPAVPVATGTLPAVAPVGLPATNQLLAALPNGRLRVLDVQDPLNPVALRELDMPADAPLGNAAVAGPMLCLVDPARKSLRIFDISGERANEVGERFVMRGEGTVEIDDDHAFFCFNEGVNTSVLSLDLRQDGVVDFSSRVGLPPVAPADAFTVADVFRAAAIRRIGRYLLVGDGLVDVGDPLRMNVLRPMTRAAAAITLANGRAYLAQGDRMSILDVNALPGLTCLGTYAPEGKGRHMTDVAVANETAYVVNNDKARPRIEVLDVGDPARPKRIGECPVPPSIVCALEGSCLYVPGIGAGTESPALVIVDVSTPEAPVIAKTIPGLVQAGCYRIRASGGRLYFTDSLRGIQVADIREPLDPKPVGALVGQTDSSCSYTDFHIVGDKLYGQRFSTLDVWRLAEPTPAGGGTP